jgi:hypothetical protein
VYDGELNRREAGDEQRISIAAPDGKSVQDDHSEAHNVSWFAFTGRKRPQDGWQPGTYHGTYTLFREGKEVARLQETVEVRRGHSTRSGVEAFGGGAGRGGAAHQGRQRTYAL